MKSFLALFVSLLLASCSLSKKPTNLADRKGKVQKDLVQTKTKKRMARKRIIFELVKDARIELFFKSLDDGSKTRVLLEKGINYRKVPAGDWELSGFMVKQKKFSLIGQSKKFVLRIRPNKEIYAGSYLLGCPVLEQERSSYLKKFSFFNRYHYSYKTNICEMVIGDNLRELKIHSSKPELGF